MGALREQSLTHVKERVALKAILDDKVRALISDIGQSVAELPIEVRRPEWALGTRPPAVRQRTLTVTSLRRVHMNAVGTGALRGVHMNAIGTGACVRSRCAGCERCRLRSAGAAAPKAAAAGVRMDPASATGACVLSQGIVVSAAACPAQVRQHPKLLRQVLALDKLVGATVKALSSASASAVHSS